MKKSHGTIFATVIGMLVVIGICAGCCLALPDYKEIVYTILGTENPAVVILEYDDDTDFDATFLVWNKSLDQGTKVTLSKSPAPTVADPSAQPHFVSKLFNIGISPGQDFSGTFLLMVRNQYTIGSGQSLGMYYWKPFRGTTNVIDAPGGVVGDDFKGHWEFIAGSVVDRAFRSISDASHTVEGNSIDRFMYEDGGDRTGQFAVGDPGPQNSAPDEPWRKWLRDNGKDDWMDPLTPPYQDYEYVGTTVVHNKMAVYTTLTDQQLEAPSQPTDLDLIHTNTRVKNRVADNDIIVAHHYRPKAAD